MARHQKTPCDNKMGNWGETMRAECTRGAFGPYTLGCIDTRASEARSYGVMKLFVLLLLVACGGETRPANACATPSSVVTCDDQNFFTFTLANDDGGHPTWTGSQCRTTPCAHGDSCEVEVNGAFVEGVCE